MKKEENEKNKIKRIYKKSKRTDSRRMNLLVKRKVGSIFI